MPAPRVISLLPSATEIVYALGLGECLVGRSHVCDFPPEAQRLPVCTRAEINPDTPSVEVDRQIQQRVGGGLPVYSLDEAQFQALRPDVVLTQDQCGVCAMPVAELRKTLARLGGTSPRLLSLSPQRLPEVWTSIQDVADALGATEQGRQFIKQLKNRVVDVILQTAPLKRRPTVACLEWIDPLMAAGNWVPELVELAGGVNLFGEAGKHSPWLKWEELQARDPEVIVVMSCGFDLERTARELPSLTRRPEWPRLQAVREGRVALTNGDHFFNRPGPRLVESLEILAEILHPRRFQFGHLGRMWRAWQPGV